MDELKNIVDDLVVDYARPEALDILSKAQKKDIDEFIRYYKEGYENSSKLNICLMHLDKLKSDLVDEGKMTYNEKDNFGRPFVLEEFKNTKKEE